MISPMTKYSFILLNGEQEGLLEKLQEIGLVDITRSVKPVDGPSGELLRAVEQRKDLVQSLGKIFFPETLEPAPVEGDLTYATAAALDALEELGEREKALEKEAAAAQPWGEFDPNLLKKLSDAGVPVQFHVCSQKSFNPEWVNQNAVQVVKEADGKVWFVVAGPDTLPDRVRCPQRSFEAVQQEIEEVQASIDQEKAILLTAKKRQAEFEAESRDKFTQLDLYLANQAAVPAAENTIVTLVGYAPTENEEAVTTAVEETGVFYLKDNAQVDDNPPISFRNNKFVKMFEVLTDM